MAKKVRLGDKVTLNNGKEITVQLIATREAAAKFNVSPVYSLSEVKAGKDDTVSDASEMSSRSSEGDAIIWGT